MLIAFFVDDRLKRFPGLAVVFRTAQHDCLVRTMEVTKGKHTLKLTCKGLPPRLRALRLESPVAFPKDWRRRSRELDISCIPPTHRRIFLPAATALLSG
jgi:hypothetical protein